MAAVNPYTIYYRDQDGQEASTTVYTTAESLAGVPTALKDQLRNEWSHAVPFKQELLFDEPLSGIAASAGPYDIRDKLTLFFRSALGHTVRVVVPAPSEAVLPDSDNGIAAGVGTSGPLHDLVTQCLIYLVTKGGEALVEYVKAKRNYKRRK